jgi:hypothetical protein
LENCLACFIAAALLVPSLMIFGSAAPSASV